MGNTTRSTAGTRRTPVHPHIRGEYSNASCNIWRALGSSPHPWGIRLTSPVTMICSRFIPTSVGNTDDGDYFVILDTVHPHIRGEYEIACEAEDDFYGSSPHPWGIPFLSTGSTTKARFIPTSVGNTRYIHQLRQCVAVHPHIRGEYWGTCLNHSDYFGSSPHPWGIHKLGDFCVRVCRFIPTSVGNTFNASLILSISSVHPHIRGEYLLLGAFVRLGTGSSPHPWGIQNGITS